MNETLKARVNEFAAKHGGYSAAARSIGTDAAYLCRLRDGKYDKPSAEVLKILGLKRYVVYVDDDNKE